MIPISRVEMYLAKICGEDVELPIPQTRKEVFLAIIAGESYEKPVPSSRVELYLAKILGDDVPLPLPQSREEIFLAVIAGEEYPLPYPESRIEYWLHKWATYEEWSTITGNPVSFTARNAPLRQLSVAFSPKQDLHGYDSPWPAGGGKNLLRCSASSETVSGVTFTVNADGSIKANGTATALIAFSVGGYTADADVSVIYNGVTGGSLSTYSINTRIGSSYTGDVSDGDSSARSMTSGQVMYFLIVIRNGVTVTDLMFYPMIRLASVTDPSFAPYSNECPILGWDSLNVEQRGKNLAEDRIANSSIGPSGVFGENTTYDMVFGKIKQGTTYTVSTNETSLVCGFFASKPNINSAAYDNARHIQTSKTFTAPIDGWIAFRVYAGYANAQLELGSTATPYVPYNPSSRSISISLGSTVYSGTVDVVTGVVTVDGIYKKLDETKTWTFTYDESTGVGQASTSGVFTRDQIISWASAPNLCNQATWARKETGNLDAGVFTLRSYGRNFQIGITGITTSEAWEAYVASNPIEVYAALTNPQTIQLTPQEVSSLLGENNMWSDANGDLTVEYRSN